MLSITMRISPKTTTLPPHLREVCDILAHGLVRLHSRAAEELARDAAATGDRGEFRLHIPRHQRVSATRTNRRAK
jgi:hypothetical protein